jgi:antitoxin HicB
MPTRDYIFYRLLTPDIDGGYVVTFRDLPEAITQGDSIAECLKEASDCLEEAIAVWKGKGAIAFSIKFCNV